MIRLAFILWLGLISLAQAAPVLVKSGEHEGFTRLVLQFSNPVDWQFGRTEDGYDLRVAHQAGGYDLSAAFKLIGKSRLAALWTDSASGDLRIGVACNCHAIPFEFRPGIVVVDIQDGPPPKGSSFEQGLQTTVGFDDSHRLMSDPKGYDWAGMALAELHSPATAHDPLPGVDAALDPLRLSLVNQLSRGASEGLVDMAQGRPKTDTEGSPQDFPSVRIAVGELPGVSATSGAPDHADISAQGQACIPAEKLDIASWGGDGPIAAQMADVNKGLIGEFDKPDPAAIRRAVQFDLFIGFGAEAAQLLRAFPTDQPDTAIWQSLADLVDRNGTQNSAFVGQAGCETPAALWAILAEQDVTKPATVNVDAAYLAFSALPIGLRRHLGPELAERFLARGDSNAATRIRDAILRAPGDAGPDVSVMDAELDLQSGKPGMAEAKLHTMLSEPGPGTPAALIALVNARVAQDLPVDGALVTTLEAVVQEQTGSDDENSARKALVLARAASGDFDGAFRDLPGTPDAEATVWRLLSIIGQDDAVLAHAVLPVDARKPPAAAETAAVLAERLLNLGLPDSALAWLPDETQADPLLLARIHLQRDDGLEAVRILDGSEGPEALSLRAAGFQQAGNDAAAAQTFATAGDSAAELLATARAQRWAEVSARGPEVWKAVAAALDTAPIAPDTVLPGPLARAEGLTEASAATREAVKALLKDVAKP